MKQAIWDKFCSRFSIAETCVPLFAKYLKGDIFIQSLVFSHQNEERLANTKKKNINSLVLADYSNRQHFYFHFF